MSDGGYKIRDKEGVHFVTFAVVEWVDVFTRKEYRDILLDSRRSVYPVIFWPFTAQFFYNRAHLLIKLSYKFSNFELYLDPEGLPAYSVSFPKSWPVETKEYSRVWTFKPPEMLEYPLIGTPAPSPLPSAAGKQHHPPRTYRPSYRPQQYSTAGEIPCQRARRPPRSCHC